MEELSLYDQVFNYVVETIDNGSAETLFAMLGLPALAAGVAGIRVFRNKKKTTSKEEEAFASDPSSPSPKE